MAYRNAVGDETSSGQNFSMITCVFLIFEISVYSNYRAKAELFLKVKQSEQQ